MRMGYSQDVSIYRYSLSRGKRPTHFGGGYLGDGNISLEPFRHSGRDRLLIPTEIVTYNLTGNRFIRDHEAVSGRRH